MVRLAMWHTIALGLGLVIGMACGGDEASCEGEEPARLHLINHTGNLIEEIVVRACDGSDELVYPVPPPGLADGEEIMIDFPSPGCWVLLYSGDGCFNDPGEQTTEDVCSGETYEWTPDLALHGCVGG